MCYRRLDLVLLDCTLLTAGMFGWVYPIGVALMPAALLGFLVRWLEIKEHKADNILWGLGLSVGIIPDFKIL